MIRPQSRKDNGKNVSITVQQIAKLANVSLGAISHVLNAPATVGEINAAERLDGFQRAMKEAGVSVGREYIQEARFISESGYAAALRLLQMLPRPTAIFASNDLFGMWHTLRPGTPGFALP